MIRHCLFSLAAVSAQVIFQPVAYAAETLLLRQPTNSATRLAFVYAGDIWVSDLDGAHPTRLTVHPGVESNPYFSPEGSQIAFTAFYGGNYDVYVIDVEGGEPKQLTYHPGFDLAQGWSPDGSRVLLSSNRNAFKPKKQFELFSVAVNGGLPVQLPMPSAFRGTFSPDGARLAYTPIKDPPFGGWKRYRGGMTPPIWLFDLASHEVEKIPHDRTNDLFPMWIGNHVYFVSDRNYNANIFSYDTTTKQLSQLTFHETFDVKHASAGANQIVYEQAGRIHLLDPITGKTRPIPISISADQPDARPQWVDPLKQFEYSSISPDGAQTAFCARGDVFLVANKSGHIRNLTRSSDVHEREPVWSPDGANIAYLSDASGENQLYIQALTDSNIVAIDLDEQPSFYYDLDWSPDGRMISLVDKHQRLMLVDVLSHRVRLIDQNNFASPPVGLDAEFSPDSRWIAYTKNMDNRLRTIFVYDTQTSQTHQVTDSMADTSHVAFDSKGHYLFLLASIDYGPKTSSNHISSLGYRQTYGVFSIPLRSDLPPRLGRLAVAGIEHQGAQPKTISDGPLEPVRIDFDGLLDRAAPLPVKPANYGDLAVTADGSLLLLEYGPDEYASEYARSTPTRTLHRFNFESREFAVFLTDINAYQLSKDGDSVLVRKGENWFTAAVANTENQQPLDLTAMRTRVDPREEWRHMFGEAWRILRDYFYDEDMHGLNWQSMRDRYTPFLDHLGHRSDLDYLIRELQGELVVGHAYIFPGDQPGRNPVPVGLLGADLDTDEDAYRITRIYRGEDWNADLEAPLDRVGLDIKVGDYLLGINDEPLNRHVNLYRLLGHTIGQETALLINQTASLEDARTVYVKPVDYAAENKLRLRHWVEHNRRIVNEMTGDRVAYIHLPDTAEWGYAYFNRYFFSQLDKQAAIIDDRFNDGGYIADYFVNRLGAPLLSYWAHRDGQLLASPSGIYGPKVMLINETAGSGGDALPLFFRRRGIGPLIGKRTWGGLVGIGSYPVMIDGGRITAPRFAIISPEGQWEVENAGVPPDIEVEQTPKRVIQGHDPQLEKAIEVILELLEASDAALLKERPPGPKRALDR